MGGAHHRLEGGLAAGKRCVNALKLLQTSSDLANAGVPMSWRHICECASQVLHGRPEHRPPARRALDGAAAGLNVIVIVGAQAEGIGWARARSLQQWTGELSTDPPWGMRAPVAVLLPCSVCHLLRPWTMCVSAASGQFGPKGTVCRYGMLHARAFWKKKSVLADVFQYLIVVCSMSKKSLFTWQIPRAEFRAPFQDPIIEPDELYL